MRADRFEFRTDDRIGVALKHQRKRAGVEPQGSEQLIAGFRAWGCGGFHFSAPGP